MGVMKTLTINGTTYSVASVVPALSVTMLASAWVKEGNKYSQVVTVEGVTSHSKVDLQPTPEQLEEFHDKVLGFTTVNDGGVVTAYAIGDKPSGDHTIQITLIEVEGTGKIRGNTVGTTMPRANLEQDDPTKADYVHGKEAFLEKVAGSGKSVKAYYDGVRTDTEAFQAALAAERVVFVPGGTYVLSDTLVIRENCCLELSQDTILKFTQTSGNCIEMRGSAVLRGNHGILWAAYGLTGHVIDMDTLKDGTDHATSIPPYEKSSPMFKRQRFIHDVNIIKPMDYYGGIGVCKSADGTCNGTAIYMSATNVSNTSTDIPWMWAINISGVRIAGGFSYGIHAINYDSAAGSSGHYEDDGWNHDMRIEAVIEQCEIGVALENCNGAHLNVTIQPGTAQNNGAKYAKNGVYLKDSRFVDMMRSRVWDWHHARDDSEEYKHIALYGNCRGLLLDDYLVTEHPNVDIRSDIYTDTPSNFDTMVILQEPANKWFKSVDNKPYFYDGTANRSLRLKSDKITAEDTTFVHSASGGYVYEPKFTNLVPTSVGTDGSLYNGKGYRLNCGMNNSGGEAPDTTSGMITGFMPISGGYHTYRVAGNNIGFNRYGCNICFYDSNHTMLKIITYDKIGTSIYYGTLTTEETTLLTWTTDANMSNIENAAYIRVSVAGQCPDLVVTVDEKVEYDAIWQGEPQRLDDSIKVKAENVIGMPSGGGGGGVSSWNDLTHKPFNSETVEILPETTVEIDPDASIGVIPGEFTFVVGKEYTVKYNGVEYVTSCVGGEGEFALGNLGALNEDLPITVEPFCLWSGAMDDGTRSLMVVVLDGSASVTVSIAYDNVTPISQKYIPKLRYDIFIKDPELVNSSIHMNYDTTELMDAISAGYPIFVHVAFSGSTTIRYTVCAIVPIIAEGKGADSVEETLGNMAAVAGKNAVPMQLHLSNLSVANSYKVNLVYINFGM